MNLQQVLTKADEKDFLAVAKVIYHNDPVWVCPLNEDILNPFKPSLNSLFIGGEAIRWVLRDSQDSLIGRIAAFYNQKKSEAEKIPTGGTGYFECINDQHAATLLFDTARNWLQEKGLKAMDAPINFGENDSNWGLLVEGFTQPVYGMPYHKPYYQNLFENYGFKLYFKQYSYHLDLTKKFPERFWKIAEWIGKKPDFSFKPFNWKESEKFIEDVAVIYNQAWSDFKINFTPLNPADLRLVMKKAKPILDPDLIWFAYYKSEPIAFFIMFPDINQILKKMHGNLNLLNKLRFYYYIKTKTITRIRAQVAGVIPRYQNSGVESGIFWHMNEKMKYKKNFTDLDLSWVGDFNPKMIALYEAVGAKKAKTHHTYRYMIDKSIPFERYMSGNPKIPLNKN